ncbi:MAG: GNAT family N-acetyltransferase [Bacillota bacterium]|nr:GNAT family N-acetyltransferase [Bacillota bacterium]
MDLDVLKQRMAPYRLVEITDREHDGIWELYTSVGSYFRSFQPFPVSLEEALADIATLPEGADPEKKHSLAAYDGAAIVAVLDFIEDFPVMDMIWLGLLLVHRDFQNRGIGSMLLRSLESVALEQGCLRMIVAVGESDLSSRLFWQSKGFDVAGITTYLRRDGFAMKYLIMDKNAIPTA